MIFDGYIYGKWGYFYVCIEKSVGVTLMVGGGRDNENLLLLLWKKGVRLICCMQKSNIFRCYFRVLTIIYAVKVKSLWYFLPKNY